MDFIKNNSAVTFLVVFGYEHKQFYHEEFRLFVKGDHNIYLFFDEKNEVYFLDNYGYEGGKTDLFYHITTVLNIDKGFTSEIEKRKVENFEMPTRTLTVKKAKIILLDLSPLKEVDEKYESIVQNPKFKGRIFADPFTGELKVPLFNAGSPSNSVTRLEEGMKYNSKDFGVSNFSLSSSNNAIKNIIAFNIKTLSLYNYTNNIVDNKDPYIVGRPDSIDFWTWFYSVYDRDKQETMILLPSNDIEERSLFLDFLFEFINQNSDDFVFKHFRKQTKIQILVNSKQKMKSGAFLASIQNLFPDLIRFVEEYWAVDQNLIKDKDFVKRADLNFTLQESIEKRFVKMEVGLTEVEVFYLYEQMKKQYSFLSNLKINIL